MVDYNYHTNQANESTNMNYQDKGLSILYTNEGTYIPQTKQGVILCMLQGGPIQYSSQFEAERHAKLFSQGWIGHAMEQQIEDVI